MIKRSEAETSLMEHKGINGGVNVIDVCVLYMERTPATKSIFYLVL